MKIIGYKYTNEAGAIQARKECAEHYGLPVEPNDTTKYWVDYSKASLDVPVFWYINFDESIEVVLGTPQTFEVTQQPIPTK